MQIIEDEYIIGRSGDLTIPHTVLQDMGLYPGARVHVAYLTQDGKKNEFREFLLSANAMDELSEEQQFRVPSQILEESNIPADADLQILCLDGCIVICRDSALSSSELAAVLERLKEAGELTSSVSGDTEQLQEQLEDFINHFQKGADSSDL